MAAWSLSSGSELKCQGQRPLVAGVTSGFSEVLFLFLLLQLNCSSRSAFDSLALLTPFPGIPLGSTVTEAGSLEKK